MKVFEGTPKGDWGEKVNFVDENNVFVGYDMSQNCCEQAEWFIADKILTKMPIERCNGNGLEDYRFDPNFFERPDALKESDGNGNSDALYNGGMVVFRMTDGKNEKFLHLFNCHNGYYGHEIRFAKDNEILLESVI